MSDTAKDVKLCLRVMINKERTKVLFAEAGSDFADVLLSFLTLPLGRIVKLLEKHYPEKPPAFGSITTLYKGIANLDRTHFTSSVAKLMLLNPRSSLDSKCCKLKLDISESRPTNFFICDDESQLCCYRAAPTILMYHDVTAVCDCGGSLDKERFLLDSEDGGVFTVDTSSFIIYDDLRMVPYSTGFISALSNLGIKNADGGELINVTLGTDEVMDLLKCSLFSKTPLSDVILRKGEISSRATPELGTGYFLHEIRQEETSNSSYKKATLKVMVHESTKKVLFAQADDDFIELLFSFLIIPVSAAESLLDTNTRLKNLDNLYTSVSDDSLDKYFVTLDTKNKLMNPELPLFYMPKNTFPHLKSEIPRTLYYHYKHVPNAKTSITFSRSPMPGSKPILCNHRSPRGEQNYVKEPTTYMVTDDLTLTPFCMSESLSILKRLNVPLSDVLELEVPIGLQEGLSILKASLSSRSALTDGLMERIRIE